MRGGRRNLFRSCDCPAQFPLKINCVVRAFLFVITIGQKSSFRGIVKQVLKPCVRATHTVNCSCLVLKFQPHARF